MRKVRICGAVFICLVSVLLIACDTVTVSAVIPERPKSIPVEAVWVGGPDGGVYINLKVDTSSSSPKYSGEVYYSSGPVWYEGAFKIVPAETDSFDLNDVDSYQGWDGDTIYLANGGHLQVLE